ncbi:MAG: hypothetical protein LBH42_08680, partial [Treponema sp.]|nr:hypothetical protein [Treponema sp.]
SGVPAPKGTQGVNISKLNLLDVLIGQLNKLKKSGLSQNLALPAKNIDALIETYTNQLKQAKASSEAMPYIPSPNIQSGTLFSLTI